VCTLSLRTTYFEESLQTCYIRAWCIFCRYIYIRINRRYITISRENIQRNNIISTRTQTLRACKLYTFSKRGYYNVKKKKTKQKIKKTLLNVDFQKSAAFAWLYNYLITLVILSHQPVITSMNSKKKKVHSITIYLK